jgi:heptosyltransferase I
MPSILIVKTSAIGDVIQTFPVLEYLRKRFPNGCIDWAVERGCSTLLKSHPLIDHVISLDTKTWRKQLSSKETWKTVFGFCKELRSKQYDLLFDLQGNSKSALVTGFAKAKIKIGFSWNSVAEKPNWLVTNTRFNIATKVNAREKYLHLVKAYFNDEESFQDSAVHLTLNTQEKERLEGLRSDYLQKQPFRLMICFGSKWPNKQLSFETLKNLMGLIHSSLEVFSVFIWSSQEEKDVADKLQSAFPDRSISLGDLSLNLWQTLMYDMNGIITVDSAALHLCGTTSTPSFSIFGSSSASAYKPLGVHHVSYQGTCPYKRSFRQRCPILRTCSSGACIRDLQAEDLFKGFMQWWRQIVLKAN